MRNHVKNAAWRSTWKLVAATGIALSSAGSADAQPSCPYSPDAYEGAANSPIALAILHCQARLVEDAAELRAAENHGIYPASVASFYEFLPEEQLLVNIATSQETEPVDGYAATRGEIGYGPISIDGVNVGYSLTTATYVLTDAEVYRTTRSTGRQILPWLAAPSSLH